MKVNEVRTIKLIGVVGKLQSVTAARWKLGKIQLGLQAKDSHKVHHQVPPI